MLPSGPTSLCFDKDAFMKAQFNVEKFILDCRRNAGLETLKHDLKLYLKVLQSAMVELINKDYADFVNLSSNLVGLDKAINNIMHPLGQLSQQVEEVKAEVAAKLEQVEEKLEKRAAIERRRTALLRLRSIVHSVEKMEQLLSLSGEGGGNLAGELAVERVAAQFNKLQFHVNRSRGQPLVERMKPRIAAITGNLQETLEEAFTAGLENRDAGLLRQCLRTYALIDKPREAENLFRHHVVGPALQELIMESALSSEQELETMFDKVYSAVDKCLKQVSDATKGNDVGRGYDFVANAIWPELVASMEARLPGLYAPGNPEVFHQRYTLSMKFVSRIETLCSTQAGVQRLRAHPSYNTFMSKWSLPVYFQIRFQEIAGGLEGALEDAANAKEGENFIMEATVILWKSLYRCWDDKVYLTALTHRFWKLSCQLIARYAGWIAEKLPTADVPLAISLITDAQVISQELSQWFDSCVVPRVKELGANPEILHEALQDSRDSLVCERENVTALVVRALSAQCATHLRSISDLPRLYRRTNRDPPTTPSNYVAQLIRPVSTLLAEHTMLPGDKAACVPAVLSEIVRSFHSNASDVLTSIKKIEESLRKLKKNKAGAGGVEKGGVSDDDKIRLQLLLDVQEMGRLMEGIEGGVVKKANDIEGYENLLTMVKSASAGEGN